MTSDSTSLIVVVDDEEMVTRSIRSFFSLELPHRTETFNSPAAALKFVESNEVDLVISDYLMPELNGIELLLKVREIRPEAVRVLLTAYSDKESAIRAINKVGLYQYVEKPWDNEELKLVVINALERRALLKMLLAANDQLDTTHSELKELQRKILKTFV